MILDNAHAELVALRASLELREARAAVTGFCSCCGRVTGPPRPELQKRLEEAQWAEREANRERYRASLGADAEGGTCNMDKET